MLECRDQEETETVSSDSIETRPRCSKKTPPDRLETEMFETETTTLIRGIFISLAEISFEIVTLSYTLLKHHSASIMS